MLLRAWKIWKPWQVPNAILQQRVSFPTRAFNCTAQHSWHGLILIDGPLENTENYGISTGTKIPSWNTAFASCVFVHVMVFLWVYKCNGCCERGNGWRAEVLILRSFVLEFLKSDWLEKLPATRETGKKRDIKLHENTEPELLANASHRDNPQTD